MNERVILFGRYDNDRSEPLYSDAKIKNPVYASAVVRDFLWGGVMSFLKRQDK